MIRQISSENIIHKTCQYTRIKWSDDSIKWYNGLNNKGSSSLDEVGFGNKESKKLENIYNKTFNENNV